ncbi:MAG: virulence-associated E family protein [Polyangiaceae bacterium]
MTERAKKNSVIRLAKGPSAEEWERHLLWRHTQSGPKLERVVANVMTILENCDAWTGAVAFDQFAERTTIVRACPATEASESVPVPWSDVHDVRTQAWLQRSKWSLNVGIDVVVAAVSTVARSRRFHPVRDYLNSIAWDGTPRLDSWLTTYLGVEATDYSRTIGTKFLVSAVARVMHPGAKADCMLILEGLQGQKKSTAVRNLVPVASWFTDEFSDFGTRDGAMVLGGAWVVEVPELDAMGRAEVSRIKAFVSRTVDRYRSPYGRHVEDHPRQCVLVGTTNGEAYLRDETGNRRFWPAKCGAIDVDGLARDRDLLWAEAVALYQDGASWWLEDAETVRAAAAEQDARYQCDAWESVVVPWLRLRALEATEAGQSKGVTVGEVLAGPLDLDKSKWNQSEQSRVGRMLKRHGWERRRLRSGDEREWRYFPVVPVVPVVGAGQGPSGDKIGSLISTLVPEVPVGPSKGKIPLFINEGVREPTETTGTGGTTGTGIGIGGDS